MFHTDLVADLPHLFQGFGGEVKLLPGLWMDRVDHQMGV